MSNKMQIGNNDNYNNDNNSNSDNVVLHLKQVEILTTTAMLTMLLKAFLYTVHQSPTLEDNIV